QLKDIAYGTKQYKFTRTITPDDDVEEFDESLQLQRVKISLRSIYPRRGHQQLWRPEPATFCTYAFYDFELQTTPVVRVLAEEHCTLEVHLAIGTDYKTVAACQLRFHDVLEKSGRIYYSAVLVGVDNDPNNYGTLEFWETSGAYWAKTRVPLIPLAHDKCVSGTFQLTDIKGNEKGTIKVTLKWKATLPASSETILTGPLVDELPKERPVPVRLLADEEVQAPKLKALEPVPLPKPRTRKSAADKKVSFIEANMGNLNPVNQTIDEEKSMKHPNPMPFSTFRRYD
ncbi:unnamed protein product, partial [Ranitomeya imitator]